MAVSVVTFRMTEVTKCSLLRFFSSFAFRRENVEVLQHLSVSLQPGWSIQGVTPRHSVRRVLLATTSASNNFARACYLFGFLVRKTVHKVPLCLAYCFSRDSPVAVGLNVIPEMCGPYPVAAHARDVRAVWARGSRDPIASQQKKRLRENLPIMRVPNQ